MKKQGQYRPERNSNPGKRPAVNAMYIADDISKTSKRMAQSFYGPGGLSNKIYLVSSNMQLKR